LIAKIAKFEQVCCYLCNLRLADVSLYVLKLSGFPGFPCSSNGSSGANLFKYFFIAFLS
jgi:hypothetical protein